MKKYQPFAIGLLGLALILAFSLSGCSGGGDAAPVSLEATVPVDQIISAPSPDPTVTPSPSPTPTATPVLETFIESTQGFAICQTFYQWNSSDVSIKVEYSGYFYTFAETGVTATYLVGPLAGQTQAVSALTTLSYGGTVQTPDCTITVDNGAVTNIADSVQ